MFILKKNNCTLQKLESLVHLCSNLAVYNANNWILGLGCCIWSPDRGHSYLLCKPCGLHFPLMSAQSPQFGSGTFPPVSWDGVLHCPSPTSSMWLPLVSSPVSAIQGWRSNQGWTVAPGLPSPAGMGGGGGLGQKQQHKSAGTSVRRAEPWSKRAA